LTPSAYPDLSVANIDEFRWRASASAAGKGAPDPSSSHPREPAEPLDAAAYGRLCHPLKGNKEFPMNNSDLADIIATDQGLSKVDARKLIDGVFSAIADAAAKGEEISVGAFGKFKVKESAAREGRNPSTGETIKIAASKKLGFAPAKAIKDRLNG
jgi:DNA-binding protein HU-beta